MSTQAKPRHFLKMHGLGNDFVVFDARTEPLKLSYGQVRALANRFTGIGCDQLIVLEPSQSADVFMRIYNADGWEVSACGNASRCVAQLLGGNPSIETKGGLLATSVVQGGARVDMGEPNFAWDKIPLAHAMDTLIMPVGWDNLTKPSAVNVGNPHVVFFVHDMAQIELGTLGPRIEHDPLFPERINVNVAQIVRDDEILLRVWERGAGLTQACGTGACATAVSAARRGLTGRCVSVHLPGGTLEIDWTADNRMHMTGPATTAFEGSVIMSHFTGN
jgi:diaminopimelate epimerase